MLELEMEDKPMLKTGPDLSYQTPAPSWAYAPPPFPTPESPESSDIPMYQPLHSDDESLPDTNDLLAPTPNTTSGNTPVEIHVDEDDDLRDVQAINYHLNEKTFRGLLTI